MWAGGAFAKAAAGAGEGIAHDFTSAVLGSLKIAFGFVFAVMVLGLLLLGAYLMLGKRK